MSLRTVYPDHRPIGYAAWMAYVRSARRGTTFRVAVLECEQYSDEDMRGIFSVIRQARGILGLLRNQK
jgi:hypothetical protein